MAIEDQFFGSNMKSSDGVMTGVLERVSVLSFALVVLRLYKYHCIV